MKIPRPTSPSLTASSAPRRSSEKGMALVIVLGLLVLVLILVIAFFSSVSVELQSAKRYSSGADARALADSAVSLVISQIQDATATPQLAWASQPGMIRTYDSNGNAVTSYKLYSSSQLRPSGNFNAVANQGTEVPASWVTDTMLYTDLNKPVAVAGSNHYPIIDPGAVAANASGSTAISGTSPAIEGCFINTSNPAVATSSTQTNPVPMPVQWMYVLKSGALAAMDPATKKVANASSNNPIVGRVAFWTDDETSKVNINTASEGTFWDRPWTSSDPSTGFEAKMTASLPAQNEYQRFPGHPAMTSLSVIFPSFTGETTAQYNKRIYDIIPRISDGGSKSGSAVVSYLTPPISVDNDRLFASVDEFLFSATSVVSGTRQPSDSGIGTKFTSDVVERTRFFLTASSRSPEVNLFNKPRITLWPLQIDPEPGTGKATRNAKDKLLAFCSTIGSGSNAKPYYFQRYSTFDYSKTGPNSRVASGSVYNPSQFPKPSSQDSHMDWDLIPRNQELYAYLQNLTSSDIPGLGGRLGGSSGKYTATGRDQILTEMFDFLRSNINLTSTGIATTSGTSGYSYAPFNPSGIWTGQFQIVPLVLPNKTKGFGLFPTITQAALIFYRTDNVLVSGTEQSDPVVTYPDVQPVTTGTTPTMSAFLILQPFTPTPGPPPWSANLRIEVDGLEKFKITTGTTTTPLGFSASAANLVTAADAECNATSLTGLELFTQYWPLNIKRPGQPVPGAVDEEKYYPFYAGSFPINTPTFNFSGGSIQIKLYSAYAKTLNSADLIQTINMTFPDGSNWPTPDVPYTRTVHTDTTTTPPVITTEVLQFNDLTTRFGATQSGGPGIQQNGQHNPLPLIRQMSTTTGDTVRAVETRYGGDAKGDYRMIAGLIDVPDSFFEGHGKKDNAADGKNYDNTAVASRWIHSLRVDSDGSSQQTGFSNGFYPGSGQPHGKLLAAASYYDAGSNPQKSNKSPVAPRGLVEALMANGDRGDWDTGIGNRMDGPFINKADLGNVGSSGTTPTGYYNSTGYDRSSNNNVLVDNGSSFSPNRQISSAVSFGSLPTGIDQNPTATVKPWQTLLFCKNPLALSPPAPAPHPGFGVGVSGGQAPPYSIPPDHAFLDLFTMPIVEPYAISEPFSTAGKVNMNYQIVPFTYLTRDTAVRAVLKSTRMMAIPTVYAINYKYGAGTGQTGGSYPPDFRYTINPDENLGTLKGFQDRFNSGDIFRSASEICDIYLVPKYLVNTTTAPPLNPTYDTMSTWWSSFQLTGDNVREQPYGHIYPRLTTKSNTYTVHVQAQSISKVSSTPADQFVDGKDQVTGEFRGAFLIERYLDPNSDSLVHADGKTPANENDADAMVGPYKFRVISTKKFAP